MWLRRHTVHTQHYSNGGLHRRPFTRVMTTDYDSILTATDSNVVNRTTYYTEGASLPDDTVAMAESVHSAGSDLYIAGAMVLMFFILSAIVCNGKTMLLFRAKEVFTFGKKSNDEGTVDTSGESLSLFAMLLLTAMSVSAVYANPIIEACSPMRALGTPYWIYAAGTAVVLGVIYLKLWIYKIINWVFFNRDSGRRWTTNYMYATAFTVFIFYPSALLSTFREDSRPIVIWVIFFTLILYESLLFCKLLANFKIRSYGYLLFFLYFCSIEVMPAVVTWQIASYYSRNIIVKNLLY